MGRRGPKTQTTEARARIARGVREQGGLYRRAEAEGRVGRPKGIPDTLDTRARKAASKMAPPGTSYWRFEYGLALERLGMLTNQSLRREQFLKEHDPDAPAEEPDV